MPRFRLILEYDGGPFVGWQYQQNGPSVQQAVEEAVFRFCGERATVHGSGRTDTGVHALGQVAHVNLVRSFASGTVRDAINFHLRPAPIVVLDTTQVADDFHARFSARQRQYLYRVLNRPSPPAYERGRLWWVPIPLDAERMARAATILVGHHDFTSFRSTMCQAETPVKTLELADGTPRWCRDPHRGAGAFVSAQSGTHHRRIAETGRRGQVVAGRPRRSA